MIEILISSAENGGFDDENNIQDISSESDYEVDDLVSSDMLSEEDGYYDGSDRDEVSEKDDVIVISDDEQNVFDVKPKRVDIQEDTVYDDNSNIIDQSGSVEKEYFAFINH